MLAAARLKAPGTTLIEGDVTHLPFPDDSFDLSLAVTLLCFTEQPQRAVAELVRVTRGDGRVVLAELNRYGLWAVWRRVRSLTGSDTWTHAHFYTPAELAVLLRRAGAREVKTGAAAYLPPGAPAWMCARQAFYERHAPRAGSFGAALSLARGEVGTA